MVQMGDVGAAIHAAAGPSSWYCSFAHIANCSGASILAHERLPTDPLASLSDCVLWGNIGSEEIVRCSGTAMIVESRMFFWNTGDDVSVDSVAQPLAGFWNAEGDPSRIRQRHSDKFGLCGNAFYRWLRVCSSAVMWRATMSLKL
jgi:hypothetical protein